MGKIYRSDRRNAWRKAGKLREWRFLPRLRTSILGRRTVKDQSGKNADYQTATYVVGASQ